MDSDALKNFIAELLATLDVTVDAITVTTGHPASTMSSRGGRTVVAVAVGEAEEARLMGPEGEHLRALTMLARRMVEAKHGAEAATFIIDFNGKGEALLEGVRNQARMLAQRARLFKHDVELEPMSAYERLVVHELFANDAEIKTESAGEGKFRHIVLKYSGTN